MFVLSSRRRHTRCALVTGVQTCALPICQGEKHAMSRFDEIYAAAMKDPEGFWAAAAGEIDWTRTWDRVLDDSDKPFCRWFAGGELNTCHNAVDRHVAAGRGEQAALIYDSPVTGTVSRLPYRELPDAVARPAGALPPRVSSEERQVREACVS